MKILGIDYGRKKIGLAIGDTTIKLAEPLPAGRRIPEIIRDNGIKKIVIGIPSGRMDEEIKKFGDRIGKETKLPVDYFDETLTTQDAQKILIASGGKRKKRRQKEDAIAAAIMLESYLNTL
ncbi:Holliday junction resolvase RuvX [Candidatus Shapirobacteria bacterium CG03_land_8_20_14_0_80_40_19]|uniref:Putative pre-16S rRNA nuclease n=4 Tax=Candidatus Shapironibacteriota TaxID=1752721 RepID=A0A2M7BCA6_9BACT|nr:MAG: Holliday junction resolvase RuvX [Candidatus Shapirobacteria bacterium CG11_big_fil_rev_8_21_14_0_20_40_12]PIV00719.1 MAG: Holliday junction resolvase RuvX [Candidatus Shapirobacteria bacterium CG03_land_8_20_14_0_80_40_19]PJC28691.1 MAG: Holliday junction resolvase RuvX [Candidatus Shapirobacteria bacterium CG_4_9_14_0_2_um_filter_40_11]PJC75942.1 MAG: Holliday junction resolvase RuvX [Candidatus Shapirobacteria bacterium CG_4_8_14_3_um_filter_39_11]